MTFYGRVSAAIRLRPEVFEEVELDPSSLKQSLIVVIVSAAAVTLGTHGRESPATIAVSIAGAILAWMLWSWLAFTIGTTVLREPNTTADWGQLLRTTGFATAPGLIAAAGMIRPFAGVAVFVAAIWTLIAMIVAVRQALDYESTVRAAAICVIGGGLYALMFLSLAA